jgi:uncharacterized membrane protein YqaE (UPF0057 family)
MKKLICFLLPALIFITGSSTVNASIIVPGIVPDSVTVSDAVTDFKNLSKKEKKEKLKLVKKEIKAFKAAKKANQEPSTNTLLLAILAILLPPLAVYLHQGETNNKFWITTLLFVLGLLGAFTIGWYLILASIVYALIVILGGA